KCPGDQAAGNSEEASSMRLNRITNKLLQGTKRALATVAMLQFSILGPLAGTAQANETQNHSGRTPIKHVIVIVGENRTFDHLFATYQPKEGESVDNLLSKGIIKKDGTPGRNFWESYQFAADATDKPTFQLAPKKKALYTHLPTPLNGGP